MGNEVKGALRAGTNRHQGKILLETNELRFRGEQVRLKIPFAEMRRVSTEAGELRIATSSGEMVFEVGPAAEKWCEKILHPKSRAEKLGVKAGLKVWLTGRFENEFLRELKTAKAEITDSRSGASNSAAVVFLSIEGQNGMASIAKQSKRLRGDQALWVVYPKGKKELSENQVIFAGRKAGLKDIKVVGFSASHTALKFVVPLDKR